MTDRQLPKRGDRYTWNGIDIEVMRVGRAGEWADLKVRPAFGPHWSKRQRLPFPESFKPADLSCWFCNQATATETPCCSSHGRDLCLACYRRLHFVEVETP